VAAPPVFGASCNSAALPCEKLRGLIPGSISEVSPEAGAFAATEICLGGAQKGMLDQDGAGKALVLGIL